MVGWQRPVVEKIVATPTPTPTHMSHSSYFSLSPCPSGTLSMREGHASRAIKVLDIPRISVFPN